VEAAGRMGERGCGFVTRKADKCGRQGRRRSDGWVGCWSDERGSGERGSGGWVRGVLEDWWVGSAEGVPPVGWVAGGALRGIS
jgi:hypothetical protein